MTTSQARETNWSRHHTFRAPRISYPTSLEQLQKLIANSRKAKVVGARHSFNDIADSTETLISLERLTEVLALDVERKTATVNAGITYGRACRLLHEAGWAIHNMASLPHITLAGAVATATHGSGDANGSLATAVSRLEMVTADGEVVILSRATHPDEFDGAIVSLGGLGAVTKLTLDIRPAYQMQQAVYEGLPLEALRFDEIMSHAYSVSLFTDWQTDRINQVWFKRVLTEEEVATGESPAFASEFYGARLAATTLHPVGDLPADGCTTQLAEVGPWHERLPHFRVDHTPASGNELQTEYFVPRRHAVDALAAVAALREHFKPILIISEVRSVAADTLWMSPFYGENGVGLHFSWYNDWNAVKPVLPRLEAALEPFQARPHWGKLFTMAPARIQSLYPRLGDFQALVEKYDPDGKFRNAYIDRYIFGVAEPAEH
jgi:alditol oxidase